MKLLIAFLILIFSLFSLAAESLLNNYFLSPNDKIDFGNLTVSPFTFQASSSISAKYGPHNLFDSNLTTYWYSENKNQDEWIIVDFFKKRLMNTIELDIPIYKNKRAVSSYMIQIMNKGIWTTISSNDNPDFKNKHFIGNIDASKIKLFIPKKENNTSVIASFKIKLNNKILNGVDEYLTGYLFPIKDGVFPENLIYLPGAPRTYRNGTHKGIDIHFRKDKMDKPIELTFQDKVIAVADGTVVRADNDYLPMTMEDYNREINYTNNENVTFVEKDFGGRQIWIDHANGVMTSYNHLSSIKSGIKKGTNVKKGDYIGTVGNSGLMGEINGTNEGIHLHFEIWVNGEFLGDKMEPEQVKKLLQYFFSPT